MRKYLCLFLLLFSGCGQPPALDDPAVLFLNLPSEPTTLNPITSTDAYESSINKFIYEPLIERDNKTLEFKPHLAKSWKVDNISKNKILYTFYLRKGVKWSDGVDFTADDIIYSFNRIKDPKVLSAPLKVYYIDVKSVKKINKYTVQFEYGRRYYRGLTFCGGMQIVPKHIFDNGEDFNRHKNNRYPIGTGPYTFKEWRTSKKIVLERNENYWGKKPEIKRIVYKFYKEPNIALKLLKRRELDYISVRPIQWMRQTNSDKFNNNFYKIKYYSPGYRFIGWNLKKYQFKDKRVRQALTHMVNRKEVLDKLLFGLGKVITGNFYCFGPDYDHNLKPLEFNPERAKELLEEAGWKDSDGDGILDKDGKPFRFTFTYGAASKFLERMATILKEDLQKVGIHMDINRYEWSIFVNKLQNRDFDAISLGWSGGYESDPYQIWHSSQAKQGSNFIGFNNKEADDIIIKARQELNPEKRKKMYNRFHQIIHDEQPYTFLFTTPNLVVISKEYDNVIQYKLGTDLLEWKVRKIHE